MDVSVKGGQKMRRFLIVAAILAIPQIAQAGPSMTTIPATLTTGYTLDTPIEAIAASPAGAAVINKDIPGLLTDRSYEIFKGMSLRLVAALSHGQLTNQMLAQVDDDLKALGRDVGRGG